MKFASIAATAALVHSAAAIPAYFVTVSCPDVVTITQTVYPPGYAATGPITYGGMAAVSGGSGSGGSGGGGGVTTSWTTTYDTTSTYCPTPGLYPPPAGLTNSLTAYMATTFTYSIAHPTGYVFNINDYNCATCSKTVVVIVVISETSIEILTEYLSIGASTTQVMTTGAAAYMVTSIPSNLTPPGGAAVMPAGASGSGFGGKYKSISDYGIFTPSSLQGFVVPTTSLAGEPFTRTRPAFSVETPYGAKYKTIGSADYGNAGIFSASSLQGFVVPTTSLAGEVFTRTGPAFTVPTNFGANYKSVSDYANGFQPYTPTNPNIVVSATASAVVAPAAATSSNPAAAPIATTSAAPSYTRYGQNYPSVNMASAFTSIPRGILSATGAAAATTPPTTAAPAAQTAGGNAAGYGAHYPSVNFNDFFTSTPTGFAFSFSAA